MRKYFKLSLIIFCPVISFASTAYATTYTFTAIDGPGTETYPVLYTYAYGINNSGKVVGYYSEFSKNPTESHGFLYEKGDLTPYNVPGFSNTFAYGINDSGNIVGYALVGTYIPGNWEDTYVIIPL